MHLYGFSFGQPFLPVIGFAGHSSFFSALSFFKHSPVDWHFEYPGGQIILEEQDEISFTHFPIPGHLCGRTLGQLVAIEH
jgi:hypothetical protein